MSFVFLLICCLQMPILTTKVEGRGNGIKTVLPNIIEVASALHVLPAYLVKFFGIELGAQSKFDASLGVHRAVVNGAHSADDLQKVTDRFIQQFVLCSACHLPELNTTVKSNGVRFQCASCGAAGSFPPAHKLVAFMTRHPPSSFPSSLGTPSQNANQDKKKKPKKSHGDAAADPKDLDPLTTSNKPVADTSLDMKNEVEKEEGVVAWHTDTSKEAREERHRVELQDMRTTAGSRSNTTTTHAEVERILLAAKSAKMDPDSPILVLKLFLASGATVRSPCEVQAELRRLAMSRSLDTTQQLRVLLAALFDETKPNEIAAQIKACAAILQRCLTTTTIDGNTLQQSASAASAASSSSSAFASGGATAGAVLLLVCLEDLVGVTLRSLLPSFAHMLQALYDNDVLEESTLLSWYAMPPEASWLVRKEVAAEVRNKAKPFIDWLQTAEEEEDDEEDNEDDTAHATS